MVDFSSLLSKPLDEVEKPLPLPAGTYHGRILKYGVGETTSDKKTPYVQFDFQIVAAGEDVDPEALVKIDLSKKQMRNSFYLTPDAEYRLKEFINSCGISTAGRTFNETLPETINQPVLISVIQKPNRDGTELFSQIDKVIGQG